MSLINPNKILGIVTEYNPFHNGHLYHLNQSKEETGANLVVAVMSGHFTQRGEPTIDDPWTRATWAVESGVDLVIQLPTVFATSSAAYFAHGAVYLLNALNCVDTLCFGSESGNLNALQTLNALLSDCSDFNAKTVKNNADQSYSVLRSDFLKQHTDTLPGLNKSNDILGLAYLEALTRIGSRIAPATIQRIVANYHDLSIEHSIASATAIRAAIKDADSSKQIMQTLPPSTIATMPFGDLGKYGPNMDLWQEWCLFHLRRTKIEDLKHVHDMADGLEHRMKSLALECEDFDTFETKLRTKIFTNARLKRVLAKMLLGIDKNDLLNDCLTNPEYIRVLAFNDRGRQLLSQAKPTLPVITNGKHYYPENKHAARQWEIDCLAADLYALLSKNPEKRRGGSQFRRPPVYIRG